MFLCRQWFQLKTYANQKNIEIIGDIPIYVEYDSVDVWVGPEYFELDEKKKVRVVAGVPPDYFSETGQRWGNPLYNWDHLAKKDFDWWIRRIKHTLNLYDIVRIDHFRGLVQYWEIPVEESTAVNGCWKPVPVDMFFSIFLGEVDKSRLIAEDLGIITDDVKAVMKKYGFPGMKILQFAFGGNLDDHPYLPHNFTEEAIVYTGTHDNNTTQGWYHHDAQDGEKFNFSKYTNITINDEYLHWDLIHLAYQSPAKCAIIPLQDFLGLGKEARINTPGTVDKNWTWRFSFDQWNDALQKEVLQYVNKADRAV